MKTKPNGRCYDNSVFEQFINEDIDVEQEQRLMQHVESCTQCQSALERVAEDDECWGEIKEQLRVSQDELTRDVRSPSPTNASDREIKKIKQLLGPTDNPEMIGRLGGFEVCGIIGRGSAGIVFKALDTRLNRYVAIKMLAPVFSTNGSSRRRFEREGRAIASVKDPNVIPVHTIGEHQGIPYIVMQYVPEGSLQQRIDNNGPLDTREVVCVAMQIAKGLASAHKHGIIHRDVKPANVLMERGVDGAMVTDFGLARVVDEATVTHSGAISGTPQYMSPEQAKGERADQRSDLFSLGSVMYAACTGHSPFRAETVFGVIKRVCESEPRSIRDLNPDVPEWLEAFINKLHQKDPSDRFESSEQVSHFLSEELAYLQAPTLVKEPERPWWNKTRNKGKKMTQIRNAVAFCILLAASMVFGAVMWDGSGNYSHLEIGTSEPNNQGSTEPSTMLALIRQEIQDQPRFTKEFEKSIPVKSGGQLYLHSNLGSVTIKKHGKTTVEMKMVHTVSAEDQETANKLFDAVKMRYELTDEEAKQHPLTDGNDAAIVADFPTIKLTEEEVEKAKQLDELKNVILMRNNSHHRNATFEVLVPEKFNLNIHTHAGKIAATEINGWAVLDTYAGQIETGDVSGFARFSTQSGEIKSGNIGNDATFQTGSGTIIVGDVGGKFFGKTGSGSITATVIEGTVEASTGSGHIEFGHLKESAKIETGQGGIKVWMAEDQVDALSGTGEMQINFVNQPAGNSSLVCNAGQIRIGYVKDLELDIEATSRHGRISAPFAKVNRGTLRHRLNMGMIGLKATTGIGGITFELIDEDQAAEEFEKWQKNQIRDANLSWGDVDKGLQVAMRLNQGEVFKFGETIPIEFLVRNVSEKTIQIESPMWRQGDSLRIWSPNGIKQQIATMMYTGIQQHQTYTLAPGSDVILKSGGIALQEKGGAPLPGMPNSPNLPAYSTELAPGDYDAVFTLDLPDIHRKARKGIWKGRPSTAMVRFTVEKNTRD